MLLLIFPLALIVAGLIWWAIQEWSEWDMLHEILMIFGSVFLFMMLVALPLSRLKTKANIFELKAFEQTVQSARANELTELERAALTQKIAEWNQWIAKEQYFKSKKAWLGIYIPNEVNGLKPIN
jgi:hypothetical protein